MAIGKERWRRVTRKSPCPICGKPDNCSVALDGSAVFCGRVEVGSVLTNQGGQHLHRHEEGWERPPIPPPPPRPAPQKDFGRIARQCHEFGRQHLHRLADQLGPSVAAWERLQTGLSGDRWTHPEFDAEGTCLGITTRSTTGDKRQMAGGRRGLILPRDFLREPGTVLCPEGASGTAALLTLGFATVGRFNNAGGMDLLVELLNRHLDEVRRRGVVLIADNDSRPDGPGPGWDGATRVARSVADYLRLSIGVSLPPDGVKDSRDWFLKFRDTASLSTLRQQFAERLQITWFHPPVLVPKPREPEPTITLDDVREQMLAARLEVVSRQGIFLDRMECGAGKTHADLQACVRALSRGLRCLVIVPTHRNCREVVDDATRLNLQAAAYPQRMTQPDPVEDQPQNCWNDQADTCEAMGLPVVSAVCMACPEQSRCQSCGYLEGLIRASDSDLAVATHCRGRVQGPDGLASSRGYVAIHEDSRELLRPTEDINDPSLESVRDFVDDASNDPRILNSRWFNSDSSGRDRGETLPQAV